jgi:hypothetical protein
MANYEDVRTPMVAVIGLIGAISTFAIVVLLMVVYQGAQQRQEYVKNVSQSPVELNDLLADQRAKLNNYRWLKEVDEGGKKREVYAIPIQRAMELVVAERSSGGRPKAEATLPSSAPGGKQPAGGGKGPGDDAK